jgi:hypothetical protein
VFFALQALVYSFPNVILCWSSGPEPLIVKSVIGNLDLNVRINAVQICIVQNIAAQLPIHHFKKCGIVEGSSTDLKESIGGSKLGGLSISTRGRLLTSGN